MKLIRFFCSCQTLIHPGYNTAFAPPTPNPDGGYPALKETTHASLKVIGEPSSPSGPFLVTVFNGLDGKEVPLWVRSTDTTAQLQAQLGEERPEWSGANLVLNGKPVVEHQCLQDLGVREGTKFVTFHRCLGG